MRQKTFSLFAAALIDGANAYPISDTRKSGFRFAKSGRRNFKSPSRPTRHKLIIFSTSEVVFDVNSDEICNHVLTPLVASPQTVTRIGGMSDVFAFLQNSACSSCGMLMTTLTGRTMRIVRSDGGSGELIHDTTTNSRRTIVRVSTRIGTAVMNELVSVDLCEEIVHRTGESCCSCLVSPI